MLNLRSYALVTSAYWGFTLTDGALRMLVLLHFHELGFTPVNLAFLFLLYEFCGIVTNLLGGWIGSRVGLKITLHFGLTIQVVAMVMLSFVQISWVEWLSVVYVMTSQALSGIAKDLTKMSSKSAVKLLVKEDSESETQSTLFKWVAMLTGSKNALKGLGFFLGGLLLGRLGFKHALWAMAGALALVLVVSLLMLKEDMGKSKAKVKFKQLFSKSREINLLSLARCFLFGSRDVWFVVGLPVFLTSQLNWSFTGVGGFMAVWVIGYGMVQAFTPRILRRKGGLSFGVRAARVWAFCLFMVSTGLALAVQYRFYPTPSIMTGLAFFGIVFAVNSSVHSYLILAYTDSDKVALNVGFYYMANACGRLIGTLLSGIMYLKGGLAWCLWTSATFVLLTVIITIFLPKQASGNSQTGPALT